MIRITQITFIYSILFMHLFSGGRTKMNTLQQNDLQDSKFETATFGGGCFWCTEAVFKQLNGVINTTVGYSGGDVENPTYEQVCTGKTGHAEVCQVVFNPVIISYTELLEVFFKTHDPTTLNHQGADVGTQYRSVIFYHNEKQKNLAIEYIKKLEREQAYSDPIVTKVEPIKNFYKAEEYHQNYFEKNPYSTYCIFVVKPKVNKARNIFIDKLKSPK